MLVLLSNPSEYKFQASLVVFQHDEEIDLIYVDHYNVHVTHLCHHSLNTDYVWFQNHLEILNKRSCTQLPNLLQRYIPQGELYCGHMTSIHQGTYITKKKEM